MINRLTRIYYLDDLLLSETDKYVMRIKLDSLNPIHQNSDSVIMILIKHSNGQSDIEFLLQSIISKMITLEKNIFNLLKSVLKELNIISNVYTILLYRGR
jgi:hypothetical protein